MQRFSQVHDHQSIFVVLDKKPQDERRLTQHSPIEAAFSLRPKRRVFATKAQQIAMHGYHWCVMLALGVVELAAIKCRPIGWIMQGCLRFRESKTRKLRQ